MNTISVPFFLPDPHLLLPYSPNLLSLFFLPTYCYPLTSTNFSKYTTVKIQLMLMPLCIIYEWGEQNRTPRGRKH